MSSNVKYQGAIEGTIKIYGGRAVGSNSDGGPVLIEGGPVDLGGRGGPMTIVASDSLAYITTPATPGYLFINFTTGITAGTDLTGLAPATLYDVKLTFDRAASNITQTVTVNGTDAPTFDDLVAQVNLQIGQSYEDVIFTSPISPSDLTGLANDATQYSFNIQVDAALTPQTVTVTGASSQTFATLITAINATLIGATASIVGSSIRFKSNGTTPPVIIVSLSDNNLFGSITPNLWTFGFNTVTALGIMELLGLPFGYLQITSNGCGGSCFGKVSSVIDGGADVQTYLFGALTNFLSTTTFVGNDPNYSQVDGAFVFIKGGNSGGTATGGSYSGVGAGNVTLRGGDAPASGPANDSRENGGAVDIIGGNGGGREAVGGHINLQAGSTGTGAIKGGDAGNVTITAGDVFGDQNTDVGSAGVIAINAGNGHHGDFPGDVIVNAGTAQATSGYWNVNFVNSPIPIIGVTPSGLGAGTYDVSFTVDGGAPFTVTLTPGTNFPTFQDVVNELNNQLVGAVASILPGTINGRIHIQSNSGDHNSVVVNNDYPVYGGGNTYLFGALNQYALSEDGPVFGTDAPGGDINMEARLTGRIFLKGAARIDHVGGIRNSAEMTFATSNNAGSGNRNVSYYTATTATTLAPLLTTTTFPFDQIDPDLDTVTTRDSFPVRSQNAVAFRLMVSARNLGNVAATEFATWHIEGAAQRSTAAASTAIIGANTTVKRDSGGNAATWTVTVTADTTLGGLIVTVSTPAFTDNGVFFSMYLEMCSLD